MDKTLVLLIEEGVASYVCDLCGFKTANPPEAIPDAIETARPQLESWKRQVENFLSDHDQSEEHGSR